FEAIAAFRVVGGERENDRPAAALLREAVSGIVGQEMLEGCKQERPETAAFLPKTLEVAPLQKRSQETLSEIARIVRIGAPPAGIRVQGIPIHLAQPGQRRARLGVVSAGRHNQTPMGSFKRHQPPTPSLQRFIPGTHNTPYVSGRRYAVRLLTSQGAPLISQPRSGERV